MLVGNNRIFHFINIKRIVIRAEWYDGSDYIYGESSGYSDYIFEDIRLNNYLDYSKYDSFNINMQYHEYPSVKAVVYSRGDNPIHVVKSYVTK